MSDEPIVGELRLFKRGAPLLPLVHGDPFHPVAWNFVTKY